MTTMTTLGDKNQNKILSRPQTPAEEIILDKGTTICQEERRPFSLSDLPFAYGTRRNCVSRLMKRGLVYVAIDSNTTFYWVTSIPPPKNGWLMTRNRMGVLSAAGTSFVQAIATIPLGAPSIHDVRLSFEAPRLYQAALGRFPSGIKKRSGDIHLPRIQLDARRSALVIVHRGNRASVHLGCTCAPFLNTEKGLGEFLEAMSEIRGSIVTALSVNVPSKNEWVVGSWHFGRDSLVEFSGESCNITVDEAEHTYRAYLKKMGDTRRLRLEKTENPVKKISQLISSRLEEC